ESARRYSADDSRLGGQCHQIGDLFLTSNGRDAFWHPNTQIDDAVRIKLQCRPASDDFSFVQLQGWDRPRAHPNFAAECGVVLSRESLPVVVWLGHNNAVNQDAGYFHLPRIERSPFGDALHLDNHEAAGILHRHRDSQNFERKRFLLHGDIAVRIGGRATDDADIDWKCAVKQKLFTVDLD